MPMILFSILAIIMVLSIAASYLIQGEFGEINIHLAAYGFILAGIGYLIEILTKRERDLDMKIGYMLNKKFIAFSEEIKTLRTMLLKMEKRAHTPDIKDEKINEKPYEKIEYSIPPKQP
jgi:hypothetical protein